MAAGLQRQQLSTHCCRYRRLRPLAGSPSGRACPRKQSLQFFGKSRPAGSCFGAHLLLRRPARGLLLWMRSGSQSPRSSRSQARSILQVILQMHCFDQLNTSLLHFPKLRLQLPAWRQEGKQQTHSRYLHPEVFNKEAFRKAMTVIFAHAAYLDAAQCFALLPIATLLKRTGREDAAVLDFDVERQSATLTANRLYG